MENEIIDGYKREKNVSTLKRGTQRIDGRCRVRKKNQDKNKKAALKYKVVRKLRQNSEAGKQQKSDKNREESGQMIKNMK